MTAEKEIQVSDFCPETGQEETVNLLEYTINGMRGKKLLPGSCENEDCPRNGTVHCRLYLKKIGKM